MSADNTMNQTLYPLGIDIGSTTVKIAVLSPQHELLFSDYERHFADIQNTLAKLLDKAYQALGEIQVAPVITGSGGLTLAQSSGSTFCPRGYRRIHLPSGTCPNKQTWP